MADPSEDRYREVTTQAVRGTLFSAGSSLVTVSLGFLRAILLARMLLPQHFGVVTLALFYVTLSGQLQMLGFDQAMIHRKDAAENLRRTYFTLRVATTAGSFLILLLVAPLLARIYPTLPLIGWILIALGGAAFVQGLSYTQETFLSKDLEFRQLAVTDLCASIVMTIVAPSMAAAGLGVWALVGEQASGAISRFGFSWLVFRRWRPRFGWDKDSASWFWKYGKPVWVASNLSTFMRRFDDFWVGTSLGSSQLGFYSRAYEFAHYPRRVAANPLVSVVTPVFARLQEDRLRLSQAFFRASFLTLRLGFLFAGGFALVMPEFIHLVIGDRWQPMLVTFRLMAVYTLLDSLAVLGENFLLAIGRPQQVQTANAFQAVFLVPAVILGAASNGINGVAVAIDGMLLSGVVILYRYVRRAVDLSLFRLAFWPIIAVAAASIGGGLIEAAEPGLGSAVSGAQKLGIFTLSYLAVLLIAERNQVMQGLRWAWGHMKSS